MHGEHERVLDRWNSNRGVQRVRRPRARIFPLKNLERVAVHRLFKKSFGQAAPVKDGPFLPGHPENGHCPSQTSPFDLPISSRPTDIGCILQSCVCSSLPCPPPRHRSLRRDARQHMRIRTTQALPNPRLPWFFRYKKRPGIPNCPVVFVRSCYSTKSNSISPITTESPSCAPAFRNSSITPHLRSARWK